MNTALTDDPSRERSLAHYVDLVRRRWMLLVVPAAVAAIVGGGVAAMRADVYRSTATVRIGDPSLPSELFDGRSSTELDLLLATSVEIIESAPFRKEVLDSLGQDESRAYRGVTANRVGETVLVDIEVKTAEKAVASTIAQAWADTYVELERRRTTGALEQRAEDLRSQIATIEDELVEVDAAISDEAAELEGSGFLSGDETPELRSLTQRRVDLLAEQSRLREQAGLFETEAALRGSGVEVAFPANAGQGPIGGGPVRTAVLAGMLGLLLGAGLAVARDELDDRVRTSEELEIALPGVPILAAVPGSIRKGRGRSVVLESDDARAEAFRTLRTNVEFIISSRPRKDAKGRIVMITSPTEGEGKSTTAASLAASLASLDRAVVLIDADLRRGVLHRHLGAAAYPGLVNVLVDEHPLDAALQQVRHPGDGDLFLLGGGRHLSPAELFGTSDFHRLLVELALVADYIIIDAPPVLPVSDALVLGHQADEVIVVVASGRTRTPQLRSAMDSLRQLGISVLGVVLNGTGRPRYDYYKNMPEMRPMTEAPEVLDVGSRRATGASQAPGDDADRTGADRGEPGGLGGNREVDVPRW